MEFLFIAKVIIVLTILSLGNSLNLEKAQSVVADPDSLESSNSTLSATRNDGSGATKQVKGNIGSITSIISNPTQIINQIQATVNTFLTTLNNTLSGSSSNITSLLGSLKNTTNKPSASGSLRLEDADLLLANISEIVRNSTKAKAELLSNASIEFENQVHGAYEDLRKTILELKGSMQENPQGSSSVPPTVETESSTNAQDTTPSSTVAPEQTSATDEQRSTENRDKSSLRSMLHQLSSIHSQVDSRIQRSISNAHSTIQESIDIARQSSQIMRNQTSSFMSDVRRVFNEMSSPIRQFFEQLRRGISTAVVSA